MEKKERNPLDLALDALKNGASEVVNIGGVYYDRKSLSEQVNSAINRLNIQRMMDSSITPNILEMVATQVIMKSMGVKP